MSSGNDARRKIDAGGGRADGQPSTYFDIIKTGPACTGAS
jgi:hypothetical protein